MTALCPGGGPSTTRPGYNTVVGLTAAAITGIITRWVGPLGADVIGALVAGVAVDLGALCGTDPPPDVDLTDAIVQDALNYVDAVRSAAAIQQVRQWFLHHYWWMACACTDASTPPMPPTQLPPGIGVNPGLPSGSTTPCWTSSVSHDGAFIDGTGTPPAVVVYLNEVLPGDRTVQVDSPLSTIASFTAKVLPSPLPRNVQARFAGTANTVPQTNVSCTIIFYDAAGHSTGFATFANSNVSWDHTIPVPVPANSASWLAWLNIGAAGTDIGKQFSVSLGVQYDCDAANTPATPCCPPDNATDLRLQQILGILNELMAGSQGGPVTSYVDGVAHRALSGSGSIMLSRSVQAIRVAVNPAVPTWPNNPGDPNYYFSMGFITTFTATSPLKGWRLVYQNQFFPIQQFADQIGFTLPPGVQVDIIEQLPAGA